MSDRFTAIGAFHSRDKAHEAIHELRAAGFDVEQIGIAEITEPGESASTKGEKGTKVEDIAAAGAAAGGTLGAVAGAVATGLIPGVGQVVAAGLLAGILGGTVLGAAAGGLIGGLVGMGIPEEDARFYDREFIAGRTIVAVRASGRSREAADILLHAGAYSVSSAKETPKPSAAPRK